MTWQDLLKNQRVKPHQTSHEELHDLRAVVERDLKDAKLDQLSADRRFATAYNAVLQLTKMVIACEGYRVTGIGHHQTTFEGLQLAMVKQVSTLVPYFVRAAVCHRFLRSEECRHTPTSYGHRIRRNTHEPLA